MIGVIMFGVVVALQLITLPVEINASHRALALLKSENTGVTACSHTHPQDASDSVNADNKLQIRQGWQT